MNPSVRLHWQKQQRPAGMCVYQKIKRNGCALLDDSVIGSGRESEDNPVHHKENADN